MNPLKTALTRKIGQAADFIGGIKRVDNAANPASAYSIAQRKQRVTLPRDKQVAPKTGPGY